MVDVSYKPNPRSAEDVSPTKTKFVKDALSTQPVTVDKIGQSFQDAWNQVNLVDPIDTNITVVAGIAQHPTRLMHENAFYYHQFALCIEGEMVVQNLANGNIYYGKPGDLYYWAPGLHIMLGGPFKAYFVKTPIPSRWVITPEGKQGVPMFELVNETRLEGSPPTEVRPVRPWQSGVNRGPRMKFLRGATDAPTTTVTDTAGKLDTWKQVELVNPTDTDFTAVAGIAEHPTNTEIEWKQRRHQVVLVLDGELVSEDADTGVTYKGHKGDVIYWPPGQNIRLGGEFRAYYVQTPITRRWISTAEGTRYMDLENIDGEGVYEDSSPDKISKERITEV